ncbi:DUF1385 domain-containing protein [Pradoshia sp.]|uniref:DUF1385 domain-containing protein n=1 Tax=Bacillaceae TaxID=186817 RepID=UPI003EFCA9C6
MNTVENKPVYGGQAVVEGVMFGGKHCTVTTIKRKDGTYDSFSMPRKSHPTIQKLKKIPFLRGIVAIIESSAVGSKHLSFSTDRFDVDPKDDDQIVQEEESSKLGMILGVAAVGILSFILGKVLFTLIPVFLAAIFQGVAPAKGAQILIEGFFKLTLLLLYIYFVSMTPLVKRVFQYHGAEHKVINAFEANKELTVENVRHASRLHYRCGSSFILFTVVVGLFLYMFVPTDPLYARILNRLALIPVVLGLSFEVLQLTNKLRDVPVLRFLGYPGLWLQLLTTKEPNDDQIQTAIISFNNMLEAEKRAGQGLNGEKIV